MAINLAKISDFFGLAEDEEIYEETPVSRKPVAKQSKRETRAQTKPMVNKSKQQQVRKEPIKRSIENKQGTTNQPARVRQSEKPTVNKEVASPTRKQEKVINMPNNEAMKKRVAAQTTSSTTRERRRISVVEPRAYNEAMVIAKRIAQGEAVLINFQSLDEGRARRIVDFLTGAVYMIDGDIKRVGNEMFLCTPTNMEVDNATLQSMDDQDIFGLEL
ncbi:cell division protein SepF [Enterococcus sp. AZ072]|uniref:cell division protein SepF n=1 Tax=unclassified Enterococcus TaxID=2608891 RepID=UPI003D2D7568